MKSIKAWLAIRVGPASFSEPLIVVEVETDKPNEKITAFMPDLRGSPEMREKIKQVAWNLVEGQITRYSLPPEFITREDSGDTYILMAPIPEHLVRWKEEVKHGQA